MPSITGNDIWLALYTDAFFIQLVPESLHSVYKEFCQLVADRLEVTADKVLTADTFVSARIVVLTLLVKEKWIERLFCSYPAGVLSFSETGYEIKKAERRLGMLLDQMQQWEGNMSDLLQHDGSSMAEFFADNEGGRLYVDTMNRWVQGGFTVGDLLRVQPSALFRI